MVKGVGCPPPEEELVPAQMPAASPELAIVEPLPVMAAQTTELLPIDDLAGDQLWRRRRRQ